MDPAAGPAEVLGHFWIYSFLDKKALIVKKKKTSNTVLFPVHPPPYMTYHVTEIL